MLPFFLLLPLGSPSCKRCWVGLPWSVWRKGIFPPWPRPPFSKAGLATPVDLNSRKIDHIYFRLFRDDWISCGSKRSTSKQSLDWLNICDIQTEFQLFSWRHYHPVMAVTDHNLRSVSITHHHHVPQYVLCYVCCLQHHNVRPALCHLHTNQWPLLDPRSAWLAPICVCPATVRAHNMHHSLCTI